MGKSHYWEELRREFVQSLIRDENSIEDLSCDMDISEKTLHRWLKECTQNGVLDYYKALDLLEDSPDEPDDEVLSLLHDAAEKGHIYAMVQIGDIYIENDHYNDSNIPYRKMAIEYLQRAADAGACIAMFLLADLGVDSMKWYIKAINQYYGERIYFEESEWIERANDCGSYPIPWSIWFSIMAINHRSWLPENEETEMKESLELAQLGFAPSMYHVATDYYLGRGTEQDYSQALWWYNHVIEQENKPFYQELNNGEGPLGCFHFAKLKIGFMYYHGLGVEKNEKLAMKWLRRANDNKETLSKNEILITAENEIIFESSRIHNRPEVAYWPTDETYSFKWFLKDAEEGQVHAMFQVGTLYDMGYGVEKNTTKAFEWFHKAAESGHAHAKKIVNSMTSDANYVNEGM